MEATGERGRIGESVVGVGEFWRVLQAVLVQHRNVGPNAVETLHVLGITSRTRILHDVNSELDNVAWAYLVRRTLLRRFAQPLIVHKSPIAALRVLQVKLKRTKKLNCLYRCKLFIKINKTKKLCISYLYKQATVSYILLITKKQLSNKQMQMKGRGAVQTRDLWTLKAKLS